MNNKDALRLALHNLVEHYVKHVRNQDAGNWNPEEEEVVIAARAALGRFSKPIPGVEQS